jgi:hypothetical protein
MEFEERIILVHTTIYCDRFFISNFIPVHTSIYLIGLYQYNKIHTGMRFSIQVQTAICQYEIFSGKVHFWYMKVHHLLTRFVLGCCSTLLACVKAAEARLAQRPKGALVQTETILLIMSPAGSRWTRRHLLFLRRRLAAQAQPGLAVLAHPAQGRPAA